MLCGFVVSMAFKGLKLTLPPPEVVCLFMEEGVGWAWLAKMAVEVGRSCAAWMFCARTSRFVLRLAETGRGGAGLGLRHLLDGAVARGQQRRWRGGGVTARGWCRQDRHPYEQEEISCEQQGEGETFANYISSNPRLGVPFPLVRI